MLDSSTRSARAVVSELINAGVQHAVLAPGSRSAPLAIALLQAEAANLLSVHVRLDERDAGFLALGLAKASRKPVPVLVTSGSAVANLFPAVVEGFQSGIPLVLLTADRPAASRGTSAPQTINQNEIFGSFVKASYDISANDFETTKFKTLLDLSQTSHAGPVHLNLQFEMPLVPAAEYLDWQPVVAVSTSSIQQQSAGVELNLSSHGLVIAGDIQDVSEAKAVGQMAEQLGWPIICEPSSNLHHHPNTLAHGVLLAASDKLPNPEVVITAGTVGLSRPILNLLKNAKQYYAIHLSGNGPDLPDPVQAADEILDQVPAATCADSSDWLDLWLRADEVASEIVARSLDTESLSGPAVALSVWNSAAASDQLVISASWPVRHIESFAPKREGLRVWGNRGANGIDGLISTAWGIGLTSDTHTYLLMGDVAFLHDIGALAVPEGVSEPDLTIVVIDNDGGGIFSQLEQGETTYADYFEKAFGTPHGKDLWQICESFDFPCTRVTTQSELTATLTRVKSVPGIQVVVCLTGSRIAENDLLKQIRTQISSSLPSSAQ